MRAGVPQQLALYDKFKDCAHFITIYIKEAHTKDEWPLGSKFSYKDPKTLEERIAIAKTFQSQFGYYIPMVVDCIENDFNNHFAAWPERYYIIHQGKLQFKAMPDGATYLWDELEDWLTNYLSATSSKKTASLEAKVADADEGIGATTTTATAIAVGGVP